MDEYVAIVTRINNLHNLEDLYPRCQYFVLKHFLKQGYKVVILNYTNKPKRSRWISNYIKIIDLPYAPSLFTALAFPSHIFLKELNKVRILYLEAWPLRNMYTIFFLVKQARNKGIFVVGDIYDLFPIYEMDISSPYIKKYKTLYNIEIKLWKKIYDNMNLVFLTSPEEYKIASKLFDITSDKSKILFYGVDTSVFNYKLFDKNSSIGYLNNRDTINICWIGNNALKKCLHIALLSISKYLEGNRKIRFIIGGKISSSLLTLLYKKINNIRYLGKVSYKQSASIYARQCDIIIAPVNPSLIHNQISIFEKVLQSILLTKPVVFTKGLATYNYLRKIGLKNYNGFIILISNTQYGKAVEYVMDNYKYFVDKLRSSYSKALEASSRNILCQKKVQLILQSYTQSL